MQLISKGGRINGIAQWFFLEMDDEGSYEVSPNDGSTSHWAVRFHPLMRPIESYGERTNLSRRPITSRAPAMRPQRHVVKW